jgi:hypothetical protein
METLDRNFYHSFPRIRPHDSRQQTISVGLAILRTIRQLGLILAPELLEWHQSLANGAYRTIILRQSRICFTELAREQVEAHGKRFGPFSLEFRIDTLRRLGALPVIYMPQQLRDDRKFSTIGATVVAELSDIRYTIQQLHQLSQVSDPNRVLASRPPGSATGVAEDFSIILRNVDPEKNVVSEKQVSAKSISDTLNYIGYRNAPFDPMDGVLSFVQSLFYPADDVLHDGLLEYYRQREWRLVAGAIVDQNLQSRTLTEAEKSTLLGIDQRFWGKVLSDGKISSRRVDDAQVIEKSDDKHVSELIHSVIVPKEAYDDAKAIFGEKVLLSAETSP